MGRNCSEIKDFVSCTLEAIGEPVMFLICGSTVHGEMTELSDIDGNVFVASNQPEELNSLNKDFERIAQEKYGKTTGGGFYEAHWSLFVYPEKALSDKRIFSRHINGLPVDFSLFALLEHCVLTPSVTTEEGSKRDRDNFCS